MSIETDQLQQQEQEILRKIFLNTLNPGSVPASETPQMVVSTSEPVEEVTQVMQGVEQRLEQANCYKLLLNESLFQGDLSTIAQQVEAEIRQFIIERLEILLGIKAEKTNSVFSEEEVVALKTVANTVMSKSKLLAQSSQVKLPTLNKTAIVRKPELKLRKTVLPQTQKVVEREVPYEPVQEAVSIPVSVPVQVPVQAKRKGGRPKKTVTSPIGVTRPDGTVVHPELSMEGQVKPGPAAARPAPMPSMAAQNMMAAAQAGEMVNNVAVNPFMASAIGQTLVKAGR